MIVWNEVVDVLREAIFAYAQACHGNVGYGIVAVTFLARLALFPLMLRIARTSADHQAVTRRLQPELDAVKGRFKNDPQKLHAEMRRLFQREGVAMVPLAGLMGGLLQMPILIALYSAVREAAVTGGKFLWVGSIARPDPLLALVVALITAASVALGLQPAAHNKALTIILPTFLTMIALTRMAAGVGVYWGVSGLVGLMQSIVLRRERREASA